MNNSKVEIWLDTSKAENDIWGLTKFLQNAEGEADKLGATLDEAVTPDTAELGDVFTTLQEMAGALDNAVEKMGELVALMSPQEGSVFDSLLGGVETFNTMADGREKLEGMQQLLCIYLKRMQQK